MPRWTRPAGRRSRRWRSCSARSEGAGDACAARSAAPHRRPRSSAPRPVASREADADLREIDFGRWEGKTFSEIRDSSPEEVERWARFAPDFAFPGGESLRDFLDRVRRAADRLAADEAETVLAVTHGGVIKAMLCRLLGLEPSRYVVFEIAPASLTVVRLFEGKGVLSEMIRVEPPEPK